MRLLITGPAGFVGGYVLREALERGHEIVAMIHNTELPKTVPVSDKLESIRFDLGSREPLDLKGHGLDAVIHLAGALSKSRGQSHRSIVDGSRQIADAAKQADIKKIVCISSIAPINFTVIPAMSVIDESASVIDYREVGDSYAKFKAEQEAVMEQFCAGNNNQLVILRPGLVYDAENISTAHAGVVRDSFSLLVSHDGQVPLIGARNLARAIIDAVELKSSGKEVMHLVDDIPPGQKEYIQYLRSRKRIDTIAMTIPFWMFNAVAIVCRSAFALVGLESRVPELFTRAGFAARLKPFRFSNARAKTRLNRSFAREY